MSKPENHVRQFANIVISRLQSLGIRGYALREVNGKSIAVEAERGRPALLVTPHRRLASLVLVLYRNCPNVAAVECGSPVRAESAERIGEILAGDDGRPNAWELSADDKRLQKPIVPPW